MIQQLHWKYEVFRRAKDYFQTARLGISIVGFALPYYRLHNLCFPFHYVQLRGLNKNTLWGEIWSHYQLVTEYFNKNSRNFVVHEGKELLHTPREMFTKILMNIKKIFVLSM